jgi:hypothetical protein
MIGYEMIVAGGRRGRRAGRRTVMGSKLPRRATNVPVRVDDGLQTLPPSDDARARDAVIDWRAALADYLKALQDLGGPPAAAAEPEREAPRRR